jgi:ABC-type sugar transport system ATPase subunit
VLLATDGDPAAFAARVDVVEELGSESFAYCLVAAEDIAAVDHDLDAIARSVGTELRVCIRLDRGVHVTAGARVALRIDPASVHLFDATDGRALAADAVGAPGL